MCKSNFKTNVVYNYDILKVYISQLKLSFYKKLHLSNINKTSSR